MPQSAESCGENLPAALVKQVEGLLIEMRTAGATDAPTRLFPLVYDELRRLAGAIMRREGPEHTLDPTSLVHEAFLRLTKQRTYGWNGRTEFISVAAQAMRRVLIDHARRKKAEKRTPGGGSGGRRTGRPADHAAARYVCHPIGARPHILRPYGGGRHDTLFFGTHCDTVFCFFR